MKRFYFLVLVFFISTVGSTYGAEGLKVDIPVVPKNVKTVFNMDHRSFNGDEPVGIKYMLLLAKRMKEANATGKIVAIFHGDAAYITH